MLVLFSSLFLYKFHFIKINPKQIKILLFFFSFFFSFNRKLILFLIKIHCIWTLILFFLTKHFFYLSFFILYKITILQYSYLILTTANKVFLSVIKQCHCPTPSNTLYQTNTYILDCLSISSLNRIGSLFLNWICCTK